MRWAVLIASWLLTPAAWAFDFPCTEQSARWQFHTAMPLAGPPVVVSPASGQARVVLASHEGYVHALSAEGRFLWSYTVRGAIVSPPSVGEGGQVWVATTQGYLYAFRGDGGVNWRFRSAFEPSAALAPSAGGMVFFPSGRRLYAASIGGGLLWSVPLGGGLADGPHVGRDGAAWLLTQEGALLRVLRASALRRAETGQEGPGQLVLTAGGAALLQGGRIQAYDSSGARLWEQSGAGLLGADPLEPERPWVLATAEGLHWLRPESGEVRDVTAFEARVSAAPLVRGGWALVPDARGLLWVVGAGGVKRCEIASAPLLTPVLDAARQQVIIAAGDGTVRAFRWPPGPES